MRLILLLVGCFVGLQQSCATAADLVITDGSKCDYQIVLPDSAPSPSVELSLQQTARLMQVAFQANGFEVLVVVEAKRDTAKPAIFLGDTAFARTQKIDVSKFKGWGYVHQVVGRDVVIAGRDMPAPAKPVQERRPTWDRIGTAKGVVDFLRQFVGTRFLYPDLGPYQPIGAAAKIDILASPAIEFLKTPKIVVPDDLNVAKTPQLEFNTAHPPRGSFYDIANNRFPLVDTIFGGHTYERAVPRETYADSHPEYFALIGGERTAKGTGNAQYCISNPDVQELFYQDLIGTIDRGIYLGCLEYYNARRPLQRHDGRTTGMAYFDTMMPTATRQRRDGIEHRHPTGAPVATWQGHEDIMIKPQPSHSTQPAA